MLHKLLERVEKMAMEKMAKKTALAVAQHPTGLDEKIKDFETTVLLSNQRTGKLQMVGIVGLGGVGKTTLAKEIFNRKHSEYNKSYFLSDVRENAKSSLHTLQSKLLKGLYLFNGHNIDNIHQGTEMLRKSLSSSQLFVILDDIDHEAALLPGRDGLRMDSLILITSRDRGVLARSGVEESSIYELKGLDTKHSEELFCSYAFCQPYPLGGFEDLVNMFLRTCDGLPLSLKVFGALLFGEKEKSHWRDILDRVHEVPNDILDRLRISYDALSGGERQIFLDIACFFIGKNKNSATTLWKGSLGFRNLQGKCLVEVDSENVIHMHDHLRDMGRKIEKDESPHRLWHPTENIDDWLQQQSSVISQARGIIMDDNNEVTNVLIRSPKFSWFQRKIDKVFGNRMKKRPGISAKKLQLLSSEGHLLERILRTVHSPNLIWLSWRDCPYSYLPSWIPMKNLRVLSVYGGVLKTLWQGESQLQELEVVGCPAMELPFKMVKGRRETVGTLMKSDSSINHIYMFRLQHLKLLKDTEISELSFDEGVCPNLQEFILEGCSNLAEVGTLPSTLHTLRIENCKKLQELRDLAQLTNLVKLEVAWCAKLEELEGIEYCISLKRLTIEGCPKLQWGKGVVERLRKKNKAVRIEVN